MLMVLRAVVVVVAGSARKAELRGTCKQGEIFLKQAGRAEEASGTSNLATYGSFLNMGIGICCFGC